MRALRIALWSFTCIGVGIGLASVNVSGKTPVEHATRAFKKLPLPKWDQVKDSVEDTVDDAKKKLSSAQDAPTEKHHDDERAAVGKIIAQRQAH